MYFPAQPCGAPGGTSFTFQNMKPNSQPNTAAGIAPRPLWRIYLAILLPMMLTNALQVTAGTLDGIYLGKMIGVEAIAAVSAFFPAFFFLLAIIIGLSTGATVLIGQAWGARSPEKARAIAGTALAVVLAAGLVVSVGGGMFAGVLLKMLGTPVDILPQASLYARIMFIGTPVIFLLWLVTSMSRGVGDAVTPMWALLLATVIAMVCTPALIRGWGGLPQLGVASAAVSTLTGFSVALAWLVRRWIRHAHPLAPDMQLLRGIRFDVSIVRRMLRIGIPASLQMLTMALAEIVLLGMVNRHGYQATAAYGAVNQVMGWVQLPAMSLGITATILSAHAIGAGNSQRLGAIVKTGLYLNMAVTGTIIALVYCLSPWIMGWFLQDASVLALAQTLLHTVAWAVLVLGAASVLTGVMRASGTVLRPAMLGMVAILGVELPLACWLHNVMGLQGIWWAYPAGFIAMLLLQAIFMRWFWRQQPVRRLL